MKISSLCLALCLGLTASAFAAPSLNDPTLQVEQVVAGLSLPTTMAFIGPNDILVLQKDDGKVRRVTNGVLQAGEVLDVAVDPTDERGLLGIALHPNFSTNHLVYLYYTESSTGSDGGSPLGNRVYHYEWNGSALINGVQILNLPATPGGPNHNGGIITFGPDGKLYVINGDLNRNGQLQNFATGPAPDGTSVIHRLNDDGSVPNDNPFFSLDAPMNRYYAYGIRNSFGMAFDPVTDKLWDTENGEATYDEINLVEPGFNSGWEKIMGPDSRNSHNAPQDLFVIPGSHYADPKFSWKRTVGPTAIVFLDSTALGAQYENDVFVGDINNGRLYHFEPNVARDGFVFTGSGLADRVADKAAELSELILGTGFSGITDLKVGPDGLLYVLSFVDGVIYRVSRTVSFGVATLPDGEVGASYDVDLAIGGGTPPYTVDVVSGALPDGLNEDDAGISGTPTLAKKIFTFTLRVTDDVGASTTKPFAIRVLKALNISTQTLKSGKVGTSYKATLKATGGKTPYTWSPDSGTFPAWAQLSPSGVITGVPPAPDSQTFTLRVTDALDGTDLQSFTLAVN
jgi:glucose/arabinose dehydrogenase